MSDDLVKRLREIQMDHDNGPYWHTIDEAADRIEALIAENELLKREKACVDDALKQQSDLALKYLNDCNEAVAYIETLTNCNSVDGLKEMHFDEFAVLPKGLAGKPVLYAVWPPRKDGSI